MEPKQMLEAVVEKAIEGGWYGTDDGDKPNELIFCDHNSVWIYDKGATGTLHWFPATLFNHKFALAYWGQEVVCADCGELVQSKGWEAWCSGFCADKFRPKASTLQWVYHLKEAVLSEDPLLYYYQHL